jgi:hypothetical protein
MAWKSKDLLYCDSTLANETAGTNTAAKTGNNLYITSPIMKQNPM